MPSEMRDHERATDRRARATVLVVSLAASATGAAAMLLGYEEALGLLILALLAVAAEVVAQVMRSSKGEGPHR